MPPIDPILVNGEPLRVCWGSNSPRVPFSYGATTALVIPTLRDQLGVELSVSATYGELAGVVNWHGIPLHPSGFTQFGNDIHAANAKQAKAHLLLTHQDVPWQEPDRITRGGVRWVPWFPIDGAPLSHTIAGRLDPTYCYQPIVLSRFGEEQARAAGIDCRFIPQGVKTRAYGDAALDALLPPYVPGSRAAARLALGWPVDAFIVGMVAANSGYPNRKAYPQQLRAFRAFAERHSDTFLYIHAFGDNQADPRVTTRLGWHLGDALLDSGRILWAHPYDLNRGYDQADMVLRYQAFDVLLGASMAEGCGLPLLEAQACGIPAITCSWSAMGENLFAGWRIEEEESIEWPVDPLETNWRLPSTAAIADRLEQAYGTSQEEYAVLARHARAQVEEHHDQAHITDTYWRPVLTELAARISAEPVPWHVHRWAGYGHPDSRGAITAPCVVEGCPAERTVEQGKEPTVYALGAPLTVAGVVLDIEDDPIGGVARAIAAEAERIYRLQDLDIPVDAVIVDIGAHVGVVSCYLSKRFPQARILAYEPVEANFLRLRRNLDANGCYNVFCYPYGVTSDGRYLFLNGNSNTNTGSYSEWAGGDMRVPAPSISVDDLWSGEHLSSVALLKLDCEGAEYEILRALNGRLPAVQNLIMEVHENEKLVSLHGRGIDLVAEAQAQVASVRASIIQIADMPARDVRAGMV